jgi:hypothetical protein
VSQTTQVSLCVQVADAQASSERGTAAQWTVSAWTTGGNVTDAVLRLQAIPASGGAPGFSFGCGKDDGTPSCDLGAVDAKSAPRQLQARLTVPVSASSVKSVSLTVIGSTAHLAKDLKAAASVSITTPPPATAGGNNPPEQLPPDQFPPDQFPPDQLPPVTGTSPLPVGSLPNIPAVSPTLAPGGNASNLFPTLSPKPGASSAPPAQKAHTRPVAETSALPEGAPVVGAQLAGLAALALAFVLAVTRLSIRRRPASTPPTPTPDNTAGPTPGAEEGNATPQEPAKDAPPTDKD